MILLMGILILGVLVGISLLALRGDDSPGSDEKTIQSQVERTSRAQEASEAACTTEKATIETAQEAFFAVHGRYAADAETLIEAGFLRSEPQWYETSTSSDAYDVSPVHGGGCS